ncbi:hypothetical protein EVAR_28727_1 [Eumeta japonica]|uniref:Uncharacterized protein n=1 Tax=Eumeta variegata TaxID=151549 RepID=A0A4C1V473_EUMVA|nr:hypothetical protein EVAR_28727_1 [Eumeta japonica]
MAVVPDALACADGLTCFAKGVTSASPDSRQGIDYLMGAMSCGGSGVIAGEWATGILTYWMKSNKSCYFTSVFC